MAAAVTAARRRLRREDGFGLVELSIAMAMLAIALLALVAALSSGVVTMQRAGAAGTAGTLADRQMEKYRAMKYTQIMLNTTDVTNAQSDPNYTADSAYSASQVTGTCTATSWPDPCEPLQNSITGPDNHTYRVDTYITAYSPTGGRQLKVITVVVRDPNHLGVPLARLQSRFDQATGQ